MDTMSSILCDALWLLYLIDMILGHYVAAFTLISVMGVIYLLQASARSDTATEVSNATLNKKRFLRVLLIACSGIPVAVRALRQNASLCPLWTLWRQMALPLQSLPQSIP